MAHEHHSTQSVSWVIMAHTLGMFGLSGVTGRLTTRDGPRPVIAAGGIVLAISAVMAPLAGTVPMLALALFLLGLGWNRYVAGSAPLCGVVVNERGHNVGISETLVAVAAAAGSFGTRPAFQRGGFIAVTMIGLALTLALLALHGATMRLTAACSPPPTNRRITHRLPHRCCRTGAAAQVACTLLENCSLPAPSRMPIHACVSKTPLCTHAKASLAVAETDSVSYFFHFLARGYSVCPIEMDDATEIVALLNADAQIFAQETLFSVSEYRVDLQNPLLDWLSMWPIRTANGAVAALAELHQRPPWVRPFLCTVLGARAAWWLGVWLMAWGIAIARTTLHQAPPDTRVTGCEHNCGQSGC